MKTRTHFPLPAHALRPSLTQQWVKSPVDLRLGEYLDVLWFAVQAAGDDPVLHGNLAQTDVTSLCGREATSARILAVSLCSRID
jgi:hypothetical protein